MALPGGFASRDDASLEATARRETLEETGIVLEEGGSLLGALDDISPRTPFLPPIIVTPHVFLVSAKWPPRPSSEVEAAVWLPVSQLFAAQNRKPFHLTFAGEVREFPSIVVGAYTIWGLTERVLHQLEELGTV